MEYQESLQKAFNENGSTRISKVQVNFDFVGVQVRWKRAALNKLTIIYGNGDENDNFFVHEVIISAVQSVAFVSDRMSSYNTKRIKVMIQKDGFYKEVHPRKLGQTKLKGHASLCSVPLLLIYWAKE